jgi:hypothetical protein
VLGEINGSLTINASTGNIVLNGKGNIIDSVVSNAVVIGDNQVVTKNGITTNVANVNENFANADLTFTDIRLHDLNGYGLIIGDNPLVNNSGLMIGATAGGIEYRSGLTKNQLQISAGDFLLNAENGNEMVLDSIGGIQITRPRFSFINIPTFTNDITAGLGGVVTHEVYKTPTGELRIKL